MPTLPLEGEVLIENDLDIHEEMHRRDWSNGLPLVPPTRARVDAMLCATQLSPNHVIGECPPMYSACTVRKVEMAFHAVLDEVERIQA